MPKSITQVQAEALAEGFDFGGSSKDAFKPVKSLGVLMRLGGELAERAANNLIRADRVATGKGAESIAVGRPEKEGSTLHVDVSMNYYLQFVDKGVKGTRGGSGEYSFKNDKPGGKMIKAITAWLTTEKRKAKTNVGGKPITKREKKRKTITGSAKSAAWPIAISIKRKGLKPTKFMTDAIKETRKDFKSEFGKTLKIDVVNALPKNLKDIK